MSQDKAETRVITFEEFCEACDEAGMVDPDRPMEALEADYRLGLVMTDLMVELDRAMEKFPPMNSAHEGFGVLQEEMDELWDHVKDKQRSGSGAEEQGGRDIGKMRKEAIQVAAMAVRFAVDICHDEKGQN